MTREKFAGEYQIVTTNAGVHVRIVGGNHEPVTDGEVLASGTQGAYTAILAVARMHSPYRRAEIDKSGTYVMVWWGLGDSPFTTVPITYMDERKPGLLAKAFGRVGRVPKDVQARAQIVVGEARTVPGGGGAMPRFWLTQGFVMDETPIRNGDSHDA